MDEVHGHRTGRTIGFASFSPASFLCIALALTSLFFLHPARAQINAIEVTFSLGWVQLPDASPFKKVILFFFLISLTRTSSRCVDYCFFLFYPYHVAQMPCESQEEPDGLDRLGADWDTVEPSLCSALTNWGLSARPFGIHRLIRHSATTTDHSQSDYTKPVLAETIAPLS